MSKEDKVSLFIVSLPFVDVGLAVSRVSRGFSEGSEKPTSRSSVAAVRSQYRNGTEELYS